MAYVDLSIEKQVATVLLNDPNSRNAMSKEMQQDFIKVVASLKGRRDLRLVVLTGAGKAFSAGGDLQMLKQKASMTKEDNARVMKEFYDSFLSLRKLNVPLLAALNGHAIGAGLCLACACDIRIIAEESMLGFTFAKLGLYPGMASTYFLRRLVGLSRATDLLLTGRLFPAKEALSMGLASTVVPSHSFSSSVQETTDNVLQGSPLVQQALLKTLRYDSSETLDEALQREALEQAVSYATKDFLEGVTAVQEKRQPCFEGV
jgi:enoyl-CoA hydratase/carnithine racemase